MARQTSYEPISDVPWRAGQVYGSTARALISGLGVGLGAIKVVTVTVTAAVNDQLHTMLVNGATITFTSDASGTKAEIATGLTAAVNASAVAGAAVHAVATATTIVLTAFNRGNDFAFSESDSNLTSAVTTAAADPTDLGFGLGVQNHASKDGHVQLPGLGTAQILTATPTHVNDTSYGLTLAFDATGDGQDEIYTSFMTSDGSATVKEILDELTIQLNRALPANTVVVTDDDAIMTLTSEQAGMSFTLTGTAGTTGTWTFAVSTANVREPFMGVSLHTQLAESSDETGVYEGGTIANIGQKDIVVAVRLDASQTPTVGDLVWCRATAGATETAGAFRTTQDATDCVPCSNCRWVAPSDGVVYRTGQDGHLIGLLAVNQD